MFKHKFSRVAQKMYPSAQLLRVILFHFVSLEFGLLRGFVAFDRNLFGSVSDWAVSSGIIVPASQLLLIYIDLVCLWERRQRAIACCNVHG